MAVVFKGEARVELNRHRYCGDGLTVTFSEGFILFQNSSGKYSFQTDFKNGIPGQLIGSKYESMTDAYLAAQVHFGKLELIGDEYVPVANA